MCGIVAAISKENIVPRLIDGLRKLEYRGYDSAGMAIVDKQQIRRYRTVGKVNELAKCISREEVTATIGIAHTRWATHGVPSEANAHPHFSSEQIAIVHNGIIENHESLRTQQQNAGYSFDSDTDTEVIAHQIHISLSANSGSDILSSVISAVSALDGSYALAVISQSNPDEIIAARSGSPLVIGIGDGEYYLASDMTALVGVTQRFIILEDNDFARINLDGVTLYDKQGNTVERAEHISQLSSNAVELNGYRHYMLKEIYEQPYAVTQTLEGRITQTKVLEESFGHDATEIFDTIEGVNIVACGTSYHAGLLARYWFEELAGIPCNVEIASEFRYRKPVARKNQLMVTISQSGETADTLAALKEAKARGFGHSLTICNSPESSLVRESDLCLMTRAGPEIGVASTKAFTTQLVSLLLLVISLGRRKQIDEASEANLVNELRTLSRKLEDALALDEQIKVLSERFADKQHALFLGRGAHYPVAMEGALKLKEISYIHAEAYAAGELKHGPLALVDSNMPVVSIAPNNNLLEKLKSNLQEVRARGGELIVFADSESGVTSGPNVEVLHVAPSHDIISPIVFNIPLQLLAYHVAVLKGTDVDHPRNLAKSVTVE
ncbi:MAG: glutamine--fructose-6-phosphate transaminase (isomerizing) [Gammaproteobacteria bacterium]|nr:glutamine--fructose-6-phosphate transaminase (isomerizing) [Gammaproteobacteria bacterium]